MTHWTCAGHVILYAYFCFDDFMYSFLLQKKLSLSIDLSIFKSFILNGKFGQWLNIDSGVL